MNFNDLPPELIVHIFSFYVRSEGNRAFLKNIPLVCKKWNDIHPILGLWKDVISNDQWTWEELNKLGEKGLLSSTRSLKLVKDGSSDEARQIVQLFIYHLRAREQKTVRTFLTRDEMMKLSAEQFPRIGTLDAQHSDVHRFYALGPFLSFHGQKLKTLILDNYFFVGDDDLVSIIAKNCPRLEELVFYEEMFKLWNEYLFLWNCKCPLVELAVGCPKLRRLKLTSCNVFVSGDGDHPNNCFREMVSFDAVCVNFHELDLYAMLKDSKNLKVLNIQSCWEVERSKILDIPPDDIEVVGLPGLENHHLGTLEKAVGRWKRTLKTLRIGNFYDIDLTKIVEAYLHENLDPKLEELHVDGCIVSLPVLRKLTEASKNLHYVNCQVDETNGYLLSTREMVANFSAIRPTE